MAALTDCRRCKRLTLYRRQLTREFPEYYNKPVPAWGAPRARLLIVGLAPGKHGANATGFPFTGDASGELLFRTLHRFGFSSRSEPDPLDPGFQLSNCCITNAVKCLPPQNSPGNDEITNCNPYLIEELARISEPGVVIALGRIAHRAVIRALTLRQKDFVFGHGAEHRLNADLKLLDSYHCSRYNIQTRRLTESMFGQVFERAADLLE